MISRIIWLWTYHQVSFGFTLTILSFDVTRNRSLTPEIDNSTPISFFREIIQIFQQFYFSKFTLKIEIRIQFDVIFLYLWKSSLFFIWLTFNSKNLDPQVLNQCFHFERLWKRKTMFLHHQNSILVEEIWFSIIFQLWIVNLSLFHFGVPGYFFIFVASRVHHWWNGRQSFCFYACS